MVERLRPPQNKRMQPWRYALRLPNKPNPISVAQANELLLEQQDQVEKLQEQTDENPPVLRTPRMALEEFIRTRPREGKIIYLNKS